jgi:hypothetical protein
MMMATAQGTQTMMMEMWDDTGKDFNDDDEWWQISDHRAYDNFAPTFGDFFLFYEKWETAIYFQNS